MRRTRAHVVFRAKLLAEIDQLIGTRGRSAFLTELAQHEVQRRKLLAALRDAKGVWKPRRHPELKGGSAYGTSCPPFSSSTIAVNAEESTAIIPEARRRHTKNPDCAPHSAPASACEPLLLAPRAARRTVPAGPDSSAQGQGALPAVHAGTAQPRRPPPHGAPTPSVAP